jgi:hypothetical protein
MIQFLCPHCSFKITAGESVAGQAAQCPLCEKSLIVPNATQKESPPLPPVDDVALAEPVDALPADDYLRSGRRDTDTRDTEHPGLANREARDYIEDLSRPRRQDEDDDEYRVQRRPCRRGLYADCPQCHAPGDATKVSFTWWGGFIGPAIINCVRCRQCGTQYNGTRGDYNGMRILIYQLVGAGIVVGFFLLGNVFNVFSAGILHGLDGSRVKAPIPASSPLKGVKR